MKSLLARIGLPRAAGLYVADGTVTLSQVVSTPLGPVEVVRHQESASPDEIPLLVQRMVRSQLGKTKAQRIPLALGLSPSRVYFATRPIQKAGGDPSPRVLLREALRSPNISVDEMLVDVIRSEPDRRPVASIVSCNKGYLGGLLTALRECGVRTRRAEPMPCALLRTAEMRHKARGGSKVVLRVFLNETSLLAILVVRNLPVVWRSADLTRGDETVAILSIIRSIITVSKDCGIASEPDVIMVHGRPDLVCLLDVEWIEEQARQTIHWFDSPGLENSDVAFGLAVGCFEREGEQAFDLAHTLKRRPHFWEIIPWRETALQIAMIAGMFFVLADHSRALNDEKDMVATRNTQHLELVSASDTDLQRERQELTQKVDAIRKFLDTRVNWTSYVRDIASCLPREVILTSFQGECEHGAGGSKQATSKPKKSLVIRGEVPLRADGATPEEIDELLNNLRANELLKLEFPVVELAELMQEECVREGLPMASFTVICLPKGSK